MPRRPVSTTLEAEPRIEGTRGFARQSRRATSRGAASETSRTKTVDKRKEDTGTIDELDRRIIVELQNDARQSDVRIAGLVGTSQASVRRRIARMIDENIIRIMAIPNQWKLGFTIAAAIGIKAEPIRLVQVSEALARMDRVHIVSITTGPFDILIWVSLRSSEDLYDFLTAKLSLISGIVGSETMIVLDLRKRDHKILPDGQSSSMSSEVELASNSIDDIDLDVPGGDAIDERDLRILEELQKDARQTDAALARKLGLSKAIVRRRVRHLLREGVAKVAVIPDPPRVGYPEQVYLGIQARPGSLDEIMTSLAAMTRVHTVCLTAGRYDIVVWATFSSRQELADFIKNDLPTISGIVRSEILTTAREVKRELSIAPLFSKNRL
ncbi:MAG: Lrp/AsnC family transcriptional regulator [Chloroflexota bacterium]|nr:MAG: Lrp/AsnC family transcriptional regulator [Chloroflexota bacterium]